MKQNLFLIFLIFFSLICTNSSVFPNINKKIHIYTTLIWEQGSIGLVMFRPVKKFTPVKAILRDVNDKIRAKAPIFQYKIISPKKKDKTVLISLFGLGPELSEGNYSIDVLSSENKELDHAAWKIQIKLKAQKYSKRVISFTSEKIDITSKITEERKKEAIKFYKVLASYNAEHIFETGTFSWPIRENWKLSSTYGEKRTFTFPSGKYQYDLHDGYDLAGLPIGTPIYAAAKGKVIFAEKRIVTGNTVIIEHLPGAFSLYYHLDKITIKKGDSTTTETLIGHLGQTGFATGPHLHFSVRINGYAVDPQFLIKNPILNIKWIIQTLNIENNIQSDLQKKKTRELSYQKSNRQKLKNIKK